MFIKDVRLSFDSSLMTNGIVQEIEVSGCLKWITVIPSQAETKRGTLVLLSSFYSGSFGIRQNFNMGLKMSRDGWDVVLSLVHPHELVYHAGKQETSLPQMAEKLGQRLDKIIAWEVDAVDAVLALLAKEQKLAAPRRPLVYFGISAGALAVPALAARHGPPDAAILTCGSASVGELIFATGLPGASADIKLAGGQSPNASERRQLAKGTRQAAHLEPEKLAPFLQDKPVLLLTAGQDAVVPTRLQRDLHAALGKPKRWHRWGGHTLTIFRLPAQWPRLRGWLQEATAQSE